ncbi:MAG: acyl-CoA dehydrogenase family protein [Fimbriimonadaceae bacterium]
MTSTQLADSGCAFFSQTASEIFTPEQFSSDELLMIQMAENFSRKEVLPNSERIEKQEDGLVPELIRQAGQLGFCGPDAPEDFGGLGLGKNIAARMLEYLSLDASFSVTIGITGGIAQFGIVLFGTEEQKKKFLPALTSGEIIGAYALSEPNSGSDALSATTRADRVGDEYVLEGTKMWISNAKWAELFMVFAKVDGERFSGFLVERDRPGLTVEREEHKLGLKGSSTARISMDKVRIPVENLLHQEGKGHQVAFNSLNLGRFKLAAMSLGSARLAFEQGVAYGRDRKQFGQPVISFGLLRQKVADMAARFFAAEAMIYRTGALIDKGFESIEEPRLAAEEFAVECSACKVFATEAQAMIVDESLQIYGGYGFTEEFPAARSFRDARVSRIYEGTNEINRLFMADRLFKRAAAGRASLDGLADTFIADLAVKAVRTGCLEQPQVGAISDLLMLMYAEQSVNARAKRTGDLGAAAAAHFINWANVEAARAFQRLTGEGVTLPPATMGTVDALSDAVIELGGPLIFNPRN